MKFLKNRVLPVVCVFSLLFSLCLPALATFDSAYLDYDSVDQWTYQFRNPTGTVNALLLDAYCELKGLPTNTDPVEVTWSFFNTAVSTYGEVDLGALNQLVSTYNGYFNLPASESGYSFGEYAVNLGRNVVAGLLGLPGMYFEVQAHPSSGLLRIKETTYDIWVVNSEGMYPYVDPNTTDNSVADQWIGEVTAADRATKEVAIHSLDRLNMMCLQLRDAGIPAQIKTLGTNYKCIWYNRQVYANAEGVPYVAWVDENKAAVNQDRPTTNVTENGDIIEGDLTDNSTNIDLENMLITLPNGAINIIDQIIYDESTKSYHIDSHDTYNYTVNNYYTWNYYINYTSITYIGQTEEYNKYYEVYYELPDGRDSADLTKEELEQLNLSIDVIPYGRSADDTSLRSLYHFDGDTRDSSYWNYCTDFTWNTGASLTYMDAGVFEGALYLDETEHDFAFTLPSMLSTHDFTLQFRYYQSATAAPVTDSYVQLGSSTVLQMSGGYFSSSGGTQLATTPVGSWNEIALIRDSGTIYTYLNGVCIGSEANTIAFDNTITFHFGDEQQTFKYFDELRVLDYALQTGGANYECTSVPHDTNLALVLPDSALPVADEYWAWDTTIKPVWAEDFSLGYSAVFKDNGTFGYYEAMPATNGGHNYLFYASSTTSIFEVVGGTSVSVSGQDMYRPNKFYGSGLAFPITSYDNSNNYYADFTGYRSNSLGSIHGKPYTFSLVQSDGSVSSLNFSLQYSRGLYDETYCRADFEWGSLYYVCCAQSNTVTYVWILPKVGETLDIVYMELVEGDTPNVNHEWVESVTILDKEDLHNPTLAVRTDLDITSYQIGGVRPSVPTKGQVWALVENERITSIQIYNGQAWEGVDGRIWTGSRWIPASSYNIVTLQDMYDIVDATPDFEYIYTESGFWTWWQKSWNAFTEKLFKVLGSGGTGSGGGCQHAYAITAETDATCTDPGERTYTCALCDNQYVESVPALGHDWIQKEETPTTYALPEGTACTDCAGLDYAAELDEDSATYSCSCNACGTVWTVQAEVTEGEILYTCSRCGETTTETDKENEGFFDALGNFLADGVEWVTDKLKQLVDSLDGLNKIFSDYVTTIREKAGDYPAFLSAAIAFMPEDLMAVFWFSVVAFVLLAVWKKWLR